MFKRSCVVLALIIFTLVSVVFPDVSFVSQQQMVPALQVATTGGIVQGQILYTLKRQLPFYSFQGIPFAEPPIGNLRFRDPVPSRPWAAYGVLNGTNQQLGCHDNMALSIFIDQQITRTSEDCLYLNVFTPKINEDSSLPVIVYIYGGTFEIGSADINEYGPDYFIEEEVILVTFNYRLGMFGFLSTSDFACPGNMGLKDQLLVLQWVQANIRGFGGDPGRVTIQGQSAGGVSVSYHYISSKSQGLFSGAIAQSGSALMQWGLQRRPRLAAFKTGFLLGIQARTSQELVDKLRTVDAILLRKVGIVVFLTFAVAGAGPNFPFAPVIEPNYPGALVTKNSFEAFQNGDFYRVPLLTGVTTQEIGLFKTIYSVIQPFLFFFDVLPVDLLFQSFNFYNPNDKYEAARKIRQKYFASKSFAASEAEELITLLTDENFIRPSIKTAQLVYKYAPVYFYQMAYIGELGLKSLKVVEGRDISGVYHSEEIGYLFRKSYIHNIQDQDQIARDRIVRLWANFAKYRNPTPTPDPLLENVIWYPVNSTDVNHLRIDVDLVYLDKFTAGNIEFWDTLLKTYARPPYYTYR